MAFKMLGYRVSRNQFVCIGPVDMDCAQTDPSYVLFCLFTIQNILSENRIDRENAGEAYNEGKFGTFKFLDFLLVILFYVAFKLYARFLNLFGFDIKPEIEVQQKGSSLLMGVYSSLKCMFFH